MNKLSYLISNKHPLYHNVLDKGVFRVVIDNVPTGFFLDIQEFEKSLGEDGIYGMCLGNCLLGGCCGIYIEVLHKDDKIIWKRFFEIMDGIRVSEEPITMPDRNEAYEVRGFPVSKDINMAPPLEFSKEEYEKLVRELKTHIKE